MGHPDFGKPVPCPHPCHDQERLRRLSDLSQLTAREQALRLKHIIRSPKNAEMIDAVKQIIARPRGWLYIWGPPGNAKTEALIAAVNEINLAGRGPALYVKLSRLVNWMRDAYGERQYRSERMRNGHDWENRGFLDRYHRVLNMPVLAIDEWDKIRETDFAGEFRFDFFDDRWRLCINEGLRFATLFAAQTPPTESAGESGPLASRFSDGRFRIIHNPAGDARPTMEWSKTDD